MMKYELYYLLIYNITGETEDMLNILKKTMLNVSNGELSAQEAYDSAEETIAFIEILGSSDHAEDNAQESSHSEGEQLRTIIETLNVEEQKMLLEKSELMNTEEMLKGRMRAEIEIKKAKLDYLKHEIADLKERCELLGKTLDAEIRDQSANFAA